MIDVEQTYSRTARALQYVDGEAEQFIAEVTEMERGVDFVVVPSKTGNKMALHFHDKAIGIRPGGWIIWDGEATRVMSNGSFQLMYKEVEQA